MTDFKNGDEVRIKATGRVVILEEVNRNPNRVDDDEIWANFTDSYQSGWIDSPDDVELVRKAEDIPAKRLPTQVELRSAISSGVFSSFGSDGVEFDETDVENDSQFIAYGTSSTGARFSVLVTVSLPEYTDF
jgi:hypothetical protein